MVGDYVRRASEAELEWPLDEGLDDARLQALLFTPSPPSGAPRTVPDWALVHRELRAHKGTTLQLLWLEYKQGEADGYQYSQFCELYRQWRGKLDVVLRQPYRAGEKAFIDYAGPTLPIVDPKTGEIRDARVFVAVLAASNYTFVDLTWTRSLPDWIGSHVRMLTFWGGVPKLLIPDNEKAGVRKASLYEPDLNPTYHDLATHYGTTVLPTRPRAPRDKAKVETGVQIVERWILAPLRNHTFFSLAEARSAVAPLLEALNNKSFQKLEGSRRSLFVEIERPALSALPLAPYEYAEWSKARVNIDYHVQVAHHLYSVPHQLARREVEVRLSAATVEIFHKARRVALHLRGRRKGGFKTEAAHMPASHRAHLEWSPSRLIRWAGTIGPKAQAFTQRLLESRPHPEQGYRSCLGLMRLARAYPTERVEAACHRALSIGALSYSSVNSILKTGLDQEHLQAELQLRLPSSHEHVRGPDYYRNPQGD